MKTHHKLSTDPLTQNAIIHENHSEAQHGIGAKLSNLLRDFFFYCFSVLRKLFSFNNSNIRLIFEWKHTTSCQPTLWPKTLLFMKTTRKRKHGIGAKLSNLLRDFFFYCFSVLRKLFSFNNSNIRLIFEWKHTTSCQPTLWPKTLLFMKTTRKRNME